MTTLADKSLLSGGDNKPPMLEKHLYDSWKSRMELYMLNRPHGRMILASVEKGPLVWPSITEDGVTRLKEYIELTPAEAIQADCDIKAINIILQGLPTEIYALVSQHRVAKDLWEKIKLLMQGTSLTKQERECKLYDEFDKFTYKKGESLHEYYLRFTLLLNDMNIYKMPLEQFQVNTKFLNTLPDEWSKFVTDVKLVKDLHTTNVDQLHAYLQQHERHANEVRLMHERNSDPLALVASHQLPPSTYQSHLHTLPNSQLQHHVSPYPSSQFVTPYQTQQFTTNQSTPLSITYPSNEYQSSVHHNVYSPQSSIPQLEYAPTTYQHQQSEFSQPDSGLIVPVFQKGDDPIDAINHMMSFLTAVVTSRYPTTNNQLRTSSNPRQQVTIYDGKVTIQLVQGRQTTYTAGTTRKYTPRASGSNTRKQRTVICYNCKGEGHIAKQCTKPKRKRVETWFNDKVLLVQAQASGRKNRSLPKILRICFFKQDMYDHPTDGIFTNASYDDEGAVADFTNLETIVNKISEALEDESWVDAVQEELLQFKIQKVWILVDLPYGKKAMGTKRDKNDIMLVQVYVDDIIFGSTKRSWCDKFEALMKSRFQMSSMGELTFFLGLQDKQKKSTLKTSHLNAVKRIFRYLKGKPKLGLWYPRVSSFDLEAYSNSDYAGANLDRKSTTGGCQFLGMRLISWQCKKQTIVATSTTEANKVVAANVEGNVAEDLDHEWMNYHGVLFGFSRESIERDIECSSSKGFLESCPKHTWSLTGKRQMEYSFMRLIRVHTGRSSIQLSSHVKSCSLLLTFVEQFMDDAKSKKINNVRYITAKVAGKPVSISEASIKSDLLFDDADGIDSLPNQAIFDAIQLMGLTLLPDLHLQLTLILPDSILEGSGGNHGGQSSSDKSLSGNKGGLTLQSVYDLYKSKDSTDKPDEGTDKPKVSTDKEEVSTDRPDEGTVDQNERRSATQTTLTTTTPTIFGDDETIVTKWRSEYLTTKPQYDETEEIEDVYLNVVIRSNRQRRYFSTLMAVLSILDRDDICAIYQLVMNRYQDETPEGFDKILWGDLIIMFNQSGNDEFWNAQQNWKIVSWKLHSSSGIHTIMTDEGIVIHMLVENKYPLKKEVLSQLLKLKLETEEDSTMALELIRFVKKQIAELEPEDSDGDEKDL
ncbi:retrovirus-related pol polyprotein from transposon TNT 1-94 [Tanacetum coccineum]